MEHNVKYEDKTILECACIQRIEAWKYLDKEMGDGPIITVAKTNITSQELNKSAHKNVINRYFVLMHYNFFFNFRL